MSTYHNQRSLTNILIFWKEVSKELTIFNISVNKKVGNDHNTYFRKDDGLLNVLFSHNSPYYLS
jgi:hypothetical protein